MSDFILLDGDKVLFLPNFGTAVVVVRPGSLSGSGPATFGGKKICVDGDEKRVSVSGCAYMTPQYCIPGSGALEIASLSPSQKAKKTKTGGKPVLLQGASFTARLKVQSPAQQPPPGPGAPIPDPTPQYSGIGMFVTTNMKLRGF